MKNRLRKKLENKLLLPKFDAIEKAENAISNEPNAIRFNDQSPFRFEIPIEAVNFPGSSGLPLTRKVIPHLLGSFKGINQSLNNAKLNPTKPKTISDEIFLQELEKYAKSIGVSSIGYTKVPEQYIFKKKAILYNNAIVLTYEMDKEQIMQAPSSNTLTMIMATYNRLGQATNKIATFLREHGYAAQSSHPLGGIVLYPALAELANLGYHGLHGLIITPEHGPRVRLSAVFTSIENLPISKKNNQEWIYDFCLVCKKCIRTCPGKAILDTPQVSKDGILTHIDNKKCFPYFLKDYGCTVCIRDCPFSDKGYDSIKKRFQRKSYKTVEEVLASGVSCKNRVLETELH